jgi:hypothetical protein
MRRATYIYHETLLKFTVDLCWWLYTMAAVNAIKNKTKPLKAKLHFFASSSSAALYVVAGGRTLKWESNRKWVKSELPKSRFLAVAASYVDDAIKPAWLRSTKQVNA